MKLWPTRAQSKEFDVFRDLDEILNEHVGFKFNGKIYKLKAVEVDVFLAFTNNLARLDALKAKETLTADELVDVYYDLSHSLCPEITKKDIARMSQAQVGALFQLMIETVTGKVDTGKKKVTAEAQGKSH